MNPWKIIGWIVLIVMILGLTFCGLVCVRVAEGVNQGRSAPSSPSGSSSAAPAAPAYLVQVISVDCDGRSRDRAQVTVRNIGTTDIPYAKAFVQFQSKDGTVLSADDSYFHPTTIPVGAQASATVYSNGSGAATCGPSAIQDGDGNPVRIQ